ncbi:MAG: hypothetical protein HGB05_06240 [Chloroflexi bacterium]|nr:hypothetical protein [Chloroflexota bacterium]
MTRVWVFAQRDLRRMAADRRALIVNLALPLVLTAVMGLSFGGGVFGKKGLSAIPVGRLFTTRTSANSASTLGCSASETWSGTGAPSRWLSALATRQSVWATWNDAFLSSGTSFFVGTGVAVDDAPQAVIHTPINSHRIHFRNILLQPAFCDKNLAGQCPTSDSGSCPRKVALVP